MGTVWKARDLSTKQLVAVKLLNLDVSQPEEVARFEREVGLLAELRHPGIVRYVAHGQADTQAFLAMEWLEGQDLAGRLLQKPLSTAEAGILLRRVAEVLSVAHQNGIIHRDVKPSNLFLCHGRPEETTVLDFGVARRGIQLTRLTRTGVVVGTPEYMAPEQARGRRDITYSADLFALGCVAFELLTGQQPFAAQHITGLLTKILFEPAPRLRTFRPDLPQPLDELVAELLEKDPLHRPQSAADVYERLCQIEFTAGDSQPRPPPVQIAAISGDELLLTTLVLATAPKSEQRRITTLDDSQAASLRMARHQVLDHLAAIGVEAALLADGSLSATIVDAFAATDQVQLAARTASILRSELVHWPVVISTGMCKRHGLFSTGPGFEQSQRILQAALDHDSHGAIWLDELSAELLHDRYLVSAAPGGYFHLGARLSEAVLRTNRLPLIGLDRELSLLHSAIHGASEDEVSRAVLVLGAPGSGKTRLYEELIGRMRDAGEDFAHLSVRLAPQNRSAPFSALIGWLRSVDQKSLDDHSERPLWQKWLFDRHPHDEAAQHQHVLSALLHHALPRPPSATPLTLPGADSVADALAALFVAAAVGRPLLLVVDNVHWIDAASRSALSTVFLRLVDTPILLLGLGRPEIDELLPRFLEGQPIDRVRMGRLPGKSADKLLCHLGIENSQRREELAHAGCGLPLYLLWLAKDETSGQTIGTRAVIAMMMSRAHRLDPQAKQVLRAAALLPDRFTQGELLQLLPTDFSLSLLDRTLAMLIDHEWLEWIRPTQVDDELTLCFRSPLLLRAMLEIVTDEDRLIGTSIVAKLRKRQSPPSQP